jgi:DNA replication protein DnaC
LSNPVNGLIDIYLSELKMPGLKKTYPDLIREAEAQGRPYSEFLVACLTHEIQSRKENRLREWIKQARFPSVKTVAEFDFTQIPSLPKPTIMALAQGDFIKRKENVICLGNSGTGKSHIATALGLSAISAGYKAKFVSVVHLVQELLLANSEYRLPKYLKSWRNFDLVVLDELGYIGLGAGGPLLFQLCAELYERSSLIITTNLEFSRWTEVFEDAVLTGALLDRLTHHSHILLFEGQSFRFKESQNQAMR